MTSSKWTELNQNSKCILTTHFCFATFSERKTFFKNVHVLKGENGKNKSHVYCFLIGITQLPSRLGMEKWIKNSFNIRGPATSVIKTLMLLDLPIGLCWVRQGNIPKTCLLNIQMTQFMLELTLSSHLTTLVEMGSQGAMHL